MSRLVYFFALCCMTHVGLGQKSLWIYPDDGGVHLVRRNSSDGYYYGAKVDQKIKVDYANTRLMDYPQYIPGYVQILSQKMTLYTYYDTGGQMSDFYRAEIRLKVRPNRDIENAYLIVEWYKDDTDKIKIACPIGKLKGGKKRSLTFELSLNKLFKDTAYRTHLMAGGVEIQSAEVDFEMDTPFEVYQKSQEGKLEDGKAEAISRNIPDHLSLFMLRKRIKDELDKRENGVEGNGEMAVKVVAEVDENGYVTRVKVADDEIKDELLASFALETVQLWTFKPKIEKGKPVESEVTIPFRL